MYKHIITIILLLLPLLAMPQSHKSNQLYKKGMELFDAEKYEEALPYFQKSDSLDKAKLKPTHKNYYRAELMVADCYEGIAVQYCNEANCTESMKIQPIVVEIRKKVLGEEHRDYITALEDLAVYYDCLGDYAKAIEIATEMIEFSRKKYGEKHTEYAKSLHRLANFYYDVDRYAESFRLDSIAMEINKEALGEEHPDYVSSLTKLAVSYYLNDNYPEAIRLETIAMEIYKKSLGEESFDYGISLHNLASFNSAIGNYAEAIRLGTISMEIYKKEFGEADPSYATSLVNLASYNSDINNYAEAIRLGTMAMEIRKNFLGEDSQEYVSSLCKLANYYYDSGNYTEAVRLGTMAVEISQEAFGEEDLNYAGSLSTLALFYFEIGNSTEAIRLGTMAMEIRKKVLGDESGNYLASYHLATFNLKEEIYDDAVKYYKKFYECISAFIMKNFASMTSRERTNFWNMRNEFSYTRSDFFSTELPSIAYTIGKSYYGVSNRSGGTMPYTTTRDTTNAPASDITALAYNGQVLSKGLLLNAELEIQKLIEQSHDTVFANRYYKIRHDRAKLDDLYQLAPDEREIDADSLSKVIENEERLLVQTFKELGDYTRKLSIDWRDIQKNLKDNDLAIEFANFKDTTINQQIYIALILKKGMKSPEMVKLFESDEFYAIKSDDYYNTPKLYNLVWKPLTKYLDGVKNVYFSPTGQFHTIGIEYLPDEDGKVFAEKFDVYRLSSTRELALENTINPNKKAATYGGIRYDADSDSTDVKRSVGAVYLDGTKVESAAVAELLRTAQYSVTALSDTSATEESFKKLSGNNLKILHIGTHGFYMSEADMENAGYKFYTSSKQSDEDKAMSCSGLLFAGANAALDLKNRSVIPEGDDGVLTAKEISRLDFNGLDLVVLSACQTGLGEVTGEGVFGLQRGFKKAGAQTIIMSLWKVFDDSTQLLITEFFKNLTAGQSKRAAFLAAQKTVREKYPNPLCWAAFIMVDGMD